jgi:hypothetical protein
LEYVVNQEEIVEYQSRAIEKAHEELGDNACQHDIAIHSIGLSFEDINEAANYVDGCVRAHIYNQTVTEGPMNPTELTEHIIGVCVPTLLLIGKMVFENRNNSVTDKYLSTVQAEMSLNAMILDKRDLSEIWPSQFVDEICATYTEPQKAFLAGVMCGKSHG